MKNFTANKFRYDELFPSERNGLSIPIDIREWMTGGLEGTIGTITTIL